MEINKFALCILDENNNPIVTKILKSNWEMINITNNELRNSLLFEYIETLTEKIKLEIDYDLIQEMFLEKLWDK